MSEGSRDPPGQGRGYPLKRSSLDAALEQAGVTNVRRVDFVRGNVRELDRYRLLIDAIYSGSESWSPWTVDVRVWSIRSSERHELETLLLGEGLLRLCAWLLGAEAAPETWRDASHRFTVSCRDGRLVTRVTRGR